MVFNKCSNGSIVFSSGGHWCWNKFWDPNHMWNFGCDRKCLVVIGINLPWNLTHVESIGALFKPNPACFISCTFVRRASEVNPLLHFSTFNISDLGSMAAA